MLPIEKVQSLIDRHTKLEKELSSGEIEKKKICRNFKRIFRFKRYSKSCKRISKLPKRNRGFKKYYK